MMASYELLDEQVHKNVAIIPIKTPINHKIDLLTLKKGFELGLVNVKECEQSTVNTIIVENKSVAPLLLVDGEEIVGGDQNRIMDATILIAPQSEKKIPVNCTEHGRWHYKGAGKSAKIFEPSKYTADLRTRSRKHRANYRDADYQGEVWNSISEFESRNSLRSPTSALNDSFENLKYKQDDYLNEFKIVEGQNGVIFIVNGELKGLELFYNHSIYKEYHEKLFRSYIIEAIVENSSEDNIERVELMRTLEKISDSTVKSNKSIGLGDNLKFSNDFGSGSSLVYDDELIHMAFLKALDDIIM